jgi:hypothetical protein
MGSSTLVNLIASMVKQESPSTNYNSALKLAVRNFTSSDVNTYLYFTIPFKLGVTISSAKLVWYTTAESTPVGTRGFQFDRLAVKFDASKLVYSNRPTSFISGSKTISKTIPWADKTKWELDITDWMQTVSNGGPWYGFRVIPTTFENEVLWMYSELYTDSAVRPRVEITWSDAPNAPSNLSPAGGRAVGVSKPIVKASFIDVSGATSLQAVQVQINSTDVWTSPSFDSGTVPSSAPELDLSRTDMPGGVWAGLADGVTTFWRIRFQDAAGLWSAWSPSTSFKRDDKGTLTLNNPPNLSGFYRMTAVVGNSGGSMGMYYRGGLPDGDPAGVASSGEVLIMSAWFRTSQARPVDLGVEFKDSSGNILGGSGTQHNLAANTWTKVTHVSGAAPASSAKFVLTAYSDDLNYTTGATLDMTGLRVSTAASPANRVAEGNGTNLSYISGLAGTGGAVSFSAVASGGPDSAVLEDATPPISWSFTGETQAAYQIQITHKVNGVDVVDWDTKKVTSTITSLTVPEGAINEPTNTTYTITLRIWDNKQRESVPNSPAYVEITRNFIFVPGPTTGTTGLSAVPDAGGKPKVVLTWTAATFPDRFNILRNGKVIATLDPNETFVSGTSHAYTDRSASPKRSLVYQVQRVVNNVASASNSTSTITVNTRGIWLQEPVTGLELLITGREDQLAVLNATESTLQAIAPNSVPVGISQSLGGLEYPISGRLSDALGLTAQQWRDIYIQIRQMSVVSLYLTVGDYTFKGIAQEFSYARVAKSSRLAFDVSFKFFQQDSINSILLGS